MRPKYVALAISSFSTEYTRTGHSVLDPRVLHEPKIHCSELYALVRGHALHGRALHHAVLQRRIGLQLAHGQLAPDAPGKKHEGVRVEHRVRVRQPLAPDVHRFNLLKVVVEAFLAHGLDAGEGGFVLGVALGSADVGVGGMYARGEKSDMR